MIFNFELGGIEYTMDLSAKLRVEIVRDLLKLWKEYCANNPNESIDFEAYLTLVEAAPHPSEVVAPLPDDEDLGDDELVELVEALKRKDKIIDGLLKLVGDVK